MSRSDDLAHGQEWPDEMTLTVEDGDRELLALLYSRAVWTLAAGRDVPAELVLEPAPRTAPPGDPAEVEREWDRAWATRLAHAGDFDGFDLTTNTLDDYLAAWRGAQDERPAAWEDRFIDGADRDAFESWTTAIDFAVDSSVRPEVQQDLVTAWRRGLTHVTLLPLTTPFARRLSKSRLLLSVGAWGDDDALREGVG